MRRYQLETMSGFVPMIVQGAAPSVWWVSGSHNDTTKECAR